MIPGSSRGLRAPLGVLLVTAGSIALAGTAAAPPATAPPDPTTPVVLLRGRVAGGCSADKAVWADEAMAMLQATGGLTPPACADERAYFFRDYAAAGFTWTHEGLPTMAAGLQPKRVVPITIWVVGQWDCLGTPPTQCPWTQLVQHAQGAFDDWRVGVSLDTLVKHVTDEGAKQRIGDSCPHIERLLDASDLRDRDRINVYWLHADQGSVWGVNCAADFVPDVVYIYNGSQLATLAHELGHVLGLRIPFPLEGLPCTWGHTNSIPGYMPCGSEFRFGNLMWDGSVKVAHISLGQAFRMNFDSHSWLNRPGAVPERFARACQSNPSVRTYACPKLGESFPEGVP